MIKKPPTNNIPNEPIHGDINSRIFIINKPTNENISNALIMQVLVENKELRKTIQELIPKIGNTTKPRRRLKEEEADDPERPKEEE